MIASAQAMGIDIAAEDRWAGDAPIGEEAILCHRAAMYPGAVTGSEDGTVQIWDFEATKALASLQGHSAPVSALSLTADGRRL